MSRKLENLDGEKGNRARDGEVEADIDVQQAVMTSREAGPGQTCSSTIR